eukprot:m.20466 g.20466  ORF g.20466 m.20466 type:complete len:147 (-) comp10217_c0_seq1:718-1158(-)
MSIEALAGKWVIDGQGDPDTFMAAIGMGWLKRKAIGVALSLGFGSAGYDITVTKGDDGTYKVTISDGKKENVIVTDGSEFTYVGPSGDSLSTAKVEGNKLVMTSMNDDPAVQVFTERWVDADGIYVTRLHCPDAGGAEWVRTCKRK